MKKLILVFAAVAISAGAYAQVDSTNSKTSPQDLNNSKNQNTQTYSAYDLHPDGVLMKDGKLMVVKNGKKTTLDQDMSMSNGTKIKTDGNYTKKDGSTMRLKEGEHMDMEGNINLMNSNNDNNMGVQQNSQNNSDYNSNSDGVFMQNGKMMQIKNGQKTAVQDNTLTMNNGTKIMSDGTCITKDGTKMKMKDGQHMDMEGNMIPMNMNKDNNMDYNQNRQINPVDKSHHDGVMMQNGKMMKVKNGQKTTLQDNEMTMNNGTKIMSDGTCITKDGSKTKMKEGQHMDMSGNMIPAKTNKDKNMYLVPDSTIKREN